ncbi:hypothetical protein MK163_12955 [bacterium]|nr:hypothetical protein [bacterium]
MLVPRSIINHFKPTRKLKNPIDLDELYPEGFNERDLALRRDPKRITWRNFFIYLDRLHRFAEWFAQNGLHPFRRRAARRGHRRGRNPDPPHRKPRLLVLVHTPARRQGLGRRGRRYELLAPGPQGGSAANLR